ncbi:MAG: cation:proton antiporter [Ruminococcaceae bacterium]|nr:cation:proton antiporter [Oscillospiraceae bacterium]
MLNNIYNDLSQSSSVASVVIATSIMLMSGFLLTRVTKRMRLPNVTAYIVAGILIGPSFLDLIPASVTEGMEFLSDIALAFIAFGTGEYFKFSKLKMNSGKVLLIAFFEALFASLLIFILCFFILKLEFSFSVVLSALASATAPASTMMTVKQTGAKGDFVDTLLLVIAFDNIIALLAYSVSVSVALSHSTGASVSFYNISMPLLKNLGVLLLGGAFGYLMKLFIQKKRSDDNRLIISVAFLFAFCGICAVLDISPLVGCMSMGTVYINVTQDDKLFKQLNYFSPPILLLFFVRSGISFDIEALLSSRGGTGSVSLLTVGILYFLFRIFGKYAGAFTACAIVKKPRRTRNLFGLALIPQAGVAIGLAALGARALGGESGHMLNTIILASSILYELVGPVCAKLSLSLSGSYSTKLEDLVYVEEKYPEGRDKTSLELLIERIQLIQKEMEQPTVNEDEHAFTEAAEELFALSNTRHEK